MVVVLTSCDLHRQRWSAWLSPARRLSAICSSTAFFLALVGPILRYGPAKQTWANCFQAFAIMRNWMRYRRRESQTFLHLSGLSRSWTSPVIATSAILRFSERWLTF